MKPKAISLRQAAERVGYSYGHARRLIAEGTFPIPALKRLGARGWHKFSEQDVDRYLATSATADAEKGL